VAVRGDSGDGVSRLLVYILKMPLGMFAAGLDLFLRTVREFQEVFNEAADSVMADVAGGPGGPAAEGWPAEVGGPAPPQPGPGPAKYPDTQPGEKERASMNDQDLGGDDAKNISYWITFIKPDYVATLQGLRTETIDYASDAGSYGGQKIGEFYQSMAAPNGIAYPQEWLNKSLPRGYGVLPPPPAVPTNLTLIPFEDRKYIKFNYTVNWRQPVPEAEREKEKVEVLREIRDALS
jgi:hypothetical protein